MTDPPAIQIARISTVGPYRLATVDGHLVRVEADDAAREYVVEDGIVREVEA
jgi:translation initiation factor 6 (eIF-6)